MDTHKSKLVSVCALLFVAGCGGGDSTDSTAAGTDGGGASAGGSNGGSANGGLPGMGGVRSGGSAGVLAGSGGGGMEGGGSDAGTTAVCPPTLPKFDSVCPAVGLACTYGDSPRPSCRSIMSCGGAMQCNCGSDNCLPSMCTTPKVWIGGGPGSGVGLTDRCNWTCPATPPKVGDPCTPPGYCAMPDGEQCGCIGMQLGTGVGLWACLPPPSDPRCPPVAPLIGSPCSDDGLSCGNYDICVTGSRVVCRSAHWADDFGSCPK